MEKNKMDTFAETTYFVRLTNDAKVFKRKTGEGEDVVLTFVDSSWLKDHEDLWVDARVANFQADRAKKYKKGDHVQVRGKLRFKRQEDGTIRGKIFDAVVSSFVKLSDREEAGAGESTPVFE